MTIQLLGEITEYNNLPHDIINSVNYFKEIWTADFTRIINFVNNFMEQAFEGSY